MNSGKQGILFKTTVPDFDKTVSKFTALFPGRVILCSEEKDDEFIIVVLFDEEFNDTTITDIVRSSFDFATLDFTNVTYEKDYWVSTGKIIGDTLDIENNLFRTPSFKVAIEQYYINLSSHSLADNENDNVLALIKEEYVKADMGMFIISSVTVKTSCLRLETKNKIVKPSDFKSITYCGTKQ